MLHKIMAFAAVVSLTACGEQLTLKDNEIGDYYAFSTSVLKNAGGARTETAPADAPFNFEDVVRNFSELAFVSNDPDGGTGQVAPWLLNRMIRWETPVRLEVFSDPDTDPRVLRALERDVRDFAAQLRRVTRHDIRLARPGEAVNAPIGLLSRKGQRVYAYGIAQAGGNFRSTSDFVATSPHDVFCYVLPGSEGPRSYPIVGAFTVIKRELPQPYYRYCVHEELTHLMGLANHNNGRPTILNSDQEFALLTKQDEIMLAMLYDRRLRPGMTLDDARPLLPAIARDAIRRLGAGRYISRSGGGT